MDPHLLLGLTLPLGTLLLNNMLLCPPGYLVIQWDMELLALDLGMNLKLDINLKDPEGLALPSARKKYWSRVKIIISVN